LILGVMQCKRSWSEYRRTCKAIR